MASFSHFTGGQPNLRSFSDNALIGDPRFDITQYGKQWGPGINSQVRDLLYSLDATKHPEEHILTYARTLESLSYPALAGNALTPANKAMADWIDKDFKHLNEEQRNGLKMMAFEDMHKIGVAATHSAHPLGVKFAHELTGGGYAQGKLPGPSGGVRKKRSSRKKSSRSSKRKSSSGRRGYPYL